MRTNTIRGFFLIFIFLVFHLAVFGQSFNDKLEEGKVLLKNKEDKAAEKIFSQLIQEYPDTLYLYLHRASTYIGQKKNELANKDYDYLISKNFKLDRCYFGKATNYYIAGDYENAKKYALMVDTDNDKIKFSIEKLLNSIQSEVENKFKTENKDELFENYAYIINKVNLRKEADTQSEVLLILSKDSRVVVVDAKSNNTWKYVLVKQDDDLIAEGYIFASFLTKTNPKSDGYTISYEHPQVSTQQSMQPQQTYTPTKNSSSSQTFTSVQCSGTTQKGSRCRRMTTSSNGRCWQH